MPGRRNFCLLLPLLAAHATPAPAQDPAPFEAELVVSSDPRGVLLRWNFAGRPAPAEGFHLFRTPAGEKKWERLTSDPVRPLPRDRAEKLLGARFEKHTGEKLPPPRTPLERRQRDLMIAMLAETDVDYARAFGLYAEDTTARRGRNYFYQLRVGEEVWATSPGVPAGEAVEVPAPTGLEASNVEQGIELVWKELDRGAARVGAFHVVRDGRRITRTPVVDLPDEEEQVRTLRFRDEEPRPGATHRYSVVAVDTFGRESAPSRPVEIARRDVVPPPRPPDFDVDEAEGQVNLSWRAPEEEDLAGFHVYRAADEPGAPVRLTASLLPKTRLTFSDRPPAGEEYDYAVTAVDTAGNESPLTWEEQGRPRRLLAPFRIRVPDRLAPAVPRGLKAELSGSAARLSWTAGAEPDLSGYAVYRSGDKEGDYARFALVSAPEFSQTLSALFQDDFFYRVSALDRSGNESAPCEPVLIRVPGRFQPVLRPLKIAGRPKFSFRAPTLGKVEVVRTRGDPSEPDAAWEKVAELPGGTADYEAPDDDFTYALVAVGPDGSRSRPRSITPPPAQVELKKVRVAGLAIELLEAEVADGTVEGILVVPFFEHRVKVKVEFARRRVVDISPVDLPRLKLDDLGLALTLTDLELERGGLSLDGTLEVAPLKLKGLRVEGLKISAGGPAGTIDVPSMKAEFAGLDFFPRRLKLGLSGRRKFAAFEADLRLVRDLEVLSTSVKVWPGRKVDVGRIKLEFEELDCAVKGEVEFDERERCFRGKVSLTLGPLGFSTQVDVVAGSGGGFNYVGVFGEANLPAPVPIGSTGLAFVKFGGGLALNMRAETDESGRVAFRPRSGGWVFRARVGIQTLDGHALKGEFTLTIDRGRKITFDGRASIYRKVDVRAKMTVGRDGLRATATVSADFKPIASGRGTVDIRFGSRRSDWYIRFGTPQSPIRGQILGTISGKFAIQINAKGDGAEFRTWVNFEFDTGKRKAWIFWGRAWLRLEATLAVDTSDWSFEAGFRASGGAEAGACVDVWLDEICVSFRLEVSASGTLKGGRGGVSIHGKFKVSAKLPVLGRESVTLSF
jgi:hypothetical protein